MVKFDEHNHHILRIICFCNFNKNYKYCRALPSHPFQHQQYGAAIMKYSVQVYVIALVYLFSSTIVSAADSYIGVEGGWSQTNFDEQNSLKTFSNLIGAPVNESHDETQTSWRVFMGKKLNDQFKLELGVFSNSDYKAHYSSNLLDTHARISFLASDLSLLFHPFNASMLDGLFVKLGVHYGELVVEADGTFFGGRFRDFQKERGVGALAGLGYELSVNERINLRATYTYLDHIAGINKHTNNVQLGVILNF